MDIDQVNQIIDPLIRCDNEAAVEFKRTLRYVLPELLKRWLAFRARINVTICLRIRQATSLHSSWNRLKPTCMNRRWGAQWHYPKIRNPCAAATRLREFGRMCSVTAPLLYVKYNFVDANTQSGMMIGGLSDQIAATHSTDKVMVDVRHNGGGNNATFGPLVDVLSTINQLNKLYVLIDRITFSAAANFVTVLDTISLSSTLFWKLFSVNEVNPSPGKSMEAPPANTTRLQRDRERSQ